MNSPYRAHPALPLKTAHNTIAFPAAAKPGSDLKGKTAPPAPPQNGGGHKLGVLLKLEGEMRQLPTWQALAYHAVNESRFLLGQQQAYLFRMNARHGFVLEAVSDVTQPDLRAPFVAALTAAINRMARPEARQTLNLHEILKSTSHPFAHGQWLPLPDRLGRPFAGLLLLRDHPWTDDVKTLADRVALAYAHSFRALTPPALLRRFAVPRWMMLAMPVLALALALVPVPLTALAPFEVVPLDQMPVTAPIDGVIASVDVEPNAPVSRGQLLFTFDDTNQKAALAVAEQNVLVAQARLNTARNGAFADQDLKRSLAVVEQELDLAKAELGNAQTALRRTRVEASANGVMVFATKSGLRGKPVRVGERVMDIADPSRVAYRIALGVGDAIALGQGAGVRLFFDADPLNPRRAAIIEETYHATETETGNLAFIIKAKPMDGELPARLGLRGTAQLAGKPVSLGFFLFRRPIAAVRQYFGV